MKKLVENVSLLLAKIFICVLLLIVSTTEVKCQSLIENNNKGAWGVAVSYGNQLDKDAVFYGWSVDYSKPIGNGPFSVGAALMWDNELERTSENRITDVSTFTFAATLNYKINDKWSIGTGLAKGFMDNDNSSRQYRFNSGDWSTGLILNYQFNIGKQRFNISGSYEYNMSQKETSLSFDLGYVLPW
ncbi:outer membrane protein transport protein [Flammeovirga yaeyamensis]|uniref:Outer membrane protein transport protein n=1 Tax=Flammeovirga yaeyamensis TaxID=367791 RepID=A0AAX1N7D0_9BACT|nr:hypothetical protein [Flammeovirga yaeyamensis]MBB3701009.1 hypothetical protein [Flammeovirga yaeyamensis]NMF38157.1 hypothetical protein [Flammeovirga yaeyamensis]QWG01927.1 outer membrane protein transport protein [Flammeovirga yaeyamensis]